jgi:hypothetical protein
MASTSVPHVKKEKRFRNRSAQKTSFRFRQIHNTGNNKGKGGALTWAANLSMSLTLLVKLICSLAVVMYWWYEMFPNMYLHTGTQ